MRNRHGKSSSRRNSTSPARSIDEGGDGGGGSLRMYAVLIFV
jgi:hypothetical protein